MRFFLAGPRASTLPLPGLILVGHVLFPKVLACVCETVTLWENGSTGVALTKPLPEAGRGAGRLLPWVDCSASDVLLPLPASGRGLGGGVFLYVVNTGNLARNPLSVATFSAVCRMANSRRAASRRGSWRLRHLDCGTRSNRHDPARSPGPPSNPGRSPGLLPWS
jgi:hypothetical protein